MWLFIKESVRSMVCTVQGIITAPEINISPVPDIVSGSRHFVPVTRNLCRSFVYDTLLKFENLSVIVTGRKRILSVTHEIVPDSDRWPVVISCTALYDVSVRYKTNNILLLKINIGQFETKVLFWTTFNPKAARGFLYSLRKWAHIALLPRCFHN